MIRKTFMILLFVLMISFNVFLTLEASATNYYVNGSTGSDSYNGLYETYQGGSNGPWETMGKAASAVPSGGHVINVAAGTYTLASSLTDSTNGASGSAMRYWLASGAVTITGYRVRLTGNYIKFDGFTVSGINIAPDWVGAIEVTGTGTVVTNCTINDVTFPGISTGAATNGCTISNCTIYDNIQAGLFAHGTNNLYLNNDISHQKYTKNGKQLNDANGVQFSGTGHVFRGNYFHDIYPYEMGSGSGRPHWDAFQTSGGGTRDILIERNHVFCGNPTTNTMEYLDSGEANIRLASLTFEGVSGDWADGIVIRNNIFECVNGYQTGGGGYVRNLKIYNNVFKSPLSASEGTPSYPTGIRLYSHEDTIVKNNIFINFKNAGFNVTSSTGTDMNYNLIWMSNGSSPSQFWRSGTGTSGAGDIPNNTNPKFVSFADSGGSLNNYQLQAGSPCKDVGLTIASVTYDYAGTSRPQGSAYDIGVYEYTTIPVPPAPPHGLKVIP